MKDELKKIFDELESDAYNKDYHTYDYKITNQIIRRNFERLFEAQTAKGGQAEVRVSFAEPNFLASLRQKFLEEFPEYEQPTHKCFVDNMNGDDSCAKEIGETCFYADAHNFTTKENCKHWNATEKYELTYYPNDIWEWFEKQMSNREARSN